MYTFYAMLFFIAIPKRRKRCLEHR